MLSDARNYLNQAWWTVFFPGLAISLMVTAPTSWAIAYAISSIRHCAAKRSEANILRRQATREGVSAQD
jgi:hypothetical protein